MKKLLLLIGITLVFYTNSFSQQNANTITTTEEEYNYVTVGYGTQVVKEGGDLKKGYTIKDLGTWGYQRTNIVFKAFYREGVLKPIAIIVMYPLVSDGSIKNYEYYCIPTPNAYALWQRTLKQVSNEDFA